MFYTIILLINPYEFKFFSLKLALYFISKLTIISKVAVAFYFFSIYVSQDIYWFTLIPILYTL